MGPMPVAVFRGAVARLPITPIRTAAYPIDGSVKIEKAFLVDEIIGEVGMIRIQTRIEHGHNNILARIALCVSLVSPNKRDAVGKTATTADIHINLHDLRMGGQFLQACF